MTAEQLARLPAMRGRWGGLCTARQYPNREYTRAAQRAARLRRIVDVMIMEWATVNYPDIVEQLYAQADIELARKDADKAHNDALKANSSKGKVIKR